jgi:hypothetical protein
MNRLSKLFGKRSSVVAPLLKCEHIRFTHQDLQTLKLVLDQYPFLFLVKHPREEIIIHFKYSFDPHINIDCLEQAHSHRNRVIDELVPVIENGIFRRVDDEKEMGRYLSTLQMWAQLMKDDLNNSWQDCVVNAQLAERPVLAPRRQLGNYVDPSLFNAIRGIQIGESVDNALIDYGVIPPAWEYGEDEYEGEYPEEAYPHRHYYP